MVFWKVEWWRASYLLCCLIYICVFLFKQNKTNSCCVLLFTCCMSNLIVPKVLMRKDLAVIFLNTDAYPNLDISSTEQNDKHTIAILRAIFHSCFSLSVILLNWRYIACGVYSVIILLKETLICMIGSNRTETHWRKEFLRSYCFLPE
jgi:hypothetical protein